MILKLIIPLICVFGASSGFRGTLPNFLGVKSEERDSSEHGAAPGSAVTTCPCGWANKANSRIVQGSFTKQNEFPWVVAVKEKGVEFSFCGGSVITAYHVLTAAHCTEDAIEDDIPLSVVLGAHDQRKPVPGISQEVDVEEILQHEQYITGPVWKHDIAILYLKKEIIFSPYIGRVCLPTQQRDYGRSYVKIIGWGDTYTDGPASPILKKVDVRVVPTGECEFMYKNVDSAKPTQICTFADRRGICQGDSGGPVVWHDPDTNRYTLVGLVSFGRACADLSPTVHSDVAYYLPWINRKINYSKKAPTCSKA